jgi:LysM repeat protein
MNNPTFFLPEGSLTEQKNKGRARAKLAVFVVLAIHGIGLLALLMQGCKKEPEPGQPSAEQAATNAAPAFSEPTNAPAAGTNVAMANPPPAVETPAVPATPPPSTEYKVLKGDNFSSIAAKLRVPLKALVDANPGVDPLKLQIGQTIHVPAGSAATPGPGSGTTAAAPSEDTSGGQVYTVKSGDTLIKIASDHKVSVKALRSANNLTTDKIKVGQKLKIPVKAAAPVSPTTASADTSAAPATSSSPTAPAGR